MNFGVIALMVATPVSLRSAATKAPSTDDPSSCMTARSAADNGLPRLCRTVSRISWRTCVPHYPDTMVMPIPGRKAVAGGGERVR
jgi:hypothetical protein